MNTLLEVENLVENLDESNYNEFRKWFYENDFNKWTDKIEEDIILNKLDNINNNAIAEYKLGKFKKI